MVIIPARCQEDLLKARAMLSDKLRVMGDKL